MTYISTLDTIEHFPKCLLLGILATRLQAVKDNEPDPNPRQKAEIEHVGVQLEKVATLPHRCSHGGRSHVALLSQLCSHPLARHTLLGLSSSSLTCLSQALILNLL